MTEPINIAGLTAEDVALAAQERLERGAGRARELYRHSMRSGVFDPDAVQLSERGRDLWREHFTFALPEVAQVVQEPFPSEVEQESTAKAVLRSADGLEFECVRIPMGRGRHTLCVSSQVGCKMGCAFCETGRMGLLRNLSAAEIVGQVLVARHVLGWSIRNVVFMGMGEALDNWDNLRQALLVLTDRPGLAFSHERLTVCTVGNVDGIRRLRGLGWKRLNLSISLNAANDELRSRLMPINRRVPLQTLQAALVDYRARANFAFAVNYCLMPDINDHPGAEQEVADFCAPLGRCLVNVIPYNPGTEALTRSPRDDEVINFIERLRSVGCAVRRRVTKGRSVMAACGQLGNLDLRQQARGS
ncbi:MAG: 23S rRNA (adenine(2503)-C(2))-methyltransferase RlmN [Planctomycetota bacterium]|jgi:23S rRNA (adenine2503-C2)-methyltransferase|nr:23S rRNA (adenine(2503)-C(2))-methyltransferase RlmN [Planctomycetota bacterium]